MKWRDKLNPFWLIQGAIFLGKWILLFILHLFLRIPALLLLFFTFLFLFVRALVTFWSVDSLYDSCIRLYGLTVGKLFHLRIQGRDKVPEKKAFIAVARHRSVNDVFLVASALKKRHLTFWARNDVLRLRLVPHIQNFVLFVDEDGSKFKPFRRGKELLEAGSSLAIFPEGSRLPYRQCVKSGVLRLAKQADVPVLPVNIKARNPYRDSEQSTRKALTNWSKILVGHVKTRVKIGPALSVEEIAKKCEQQTGRSLSARDDELTEFLLNQIVDKT